MGDNADPPFANFGHGAASISNASGTSGPESGVSPACAHAAEGAAPRTIQRIPGELTAGATGLRATSSVLVLTVQEVDRVRSN